MIAPLIPLIALLVPVQEPQAVPAPRDVPAPVQASVAAGGEVPDPPAGERVPEGAFAPVVIEGWEEVLERQAGAPLFEPPVRRFRAGAPGAWHLPDEGELPARSGERALTNEWGDPRMPLGFGRPVDSPSLWLRGGASEGTAAEQARLVVVTEDGERFVGDWQAIREEYSELSTDRERVVSLEVELRKAGWEQAWMLVDDLSYTVGGERVVVDFEDAPLGDLTGSGYAGLEWLAGLGLERRAPGPVALLTRPQPQPLAPLPPLAPAAPAAGVIDAPTLLQGFFCQELGSQPGTGAIPPDTHGAVGPNHFVSVVNSNITIYNKSGGQIATASLSSFFNGGGHGDPRVVFDPRANRWIVLSTNFSDRIYLAVSTSDSAQGTWLKTSFLVGQGVDANHWPDYPTLGVDERGVTIGALMIDNASGAGTMTIWALDKAPLIAASPSVGTVTAFRDLPYTKANQPAVHWDDPGVGYVACVWGGNQLLVRQVNPPLTNPTLTTASLITVATHNDPPNAPAQGSGVPINTGDDRLQNAVFRGDHLYTCHTVGTNLGTAAVRWNEVNPASGADIQRSTIRDDAGSFSYYHPSIAVNSVGDIVLGFSGSSSSTYVGCYMAGRRASDTPNDISDPVEYKVGTGAYQNLDGAGRNRWGDYSGTTADPTDDTFWTVQTFARSGNLWRLRAAQLEYDQTLISNYCVTTSNSVGSGALISASGSTSVSANDLVLIATGMPANQFMLFFYSFGQGQTPVANGILCVTNPLYRLAPHQISALGDATHAFDVAGPGPAAAVVDPGETAFFQAWYRDPAAGGANSNFSDGLQTTWVQ